MLSNTSSERITSGLAQAVEHWKKRHGASAPPTDAPPRWTVAIAREAGSRGSPIAKRVGELLGWPVYDRELLQRIADEKGLRVQLLDSVDEKHTSWLETCLEGVVTGPHGDAVLPGRAWRLHHCRPWVGSDFATENHSPRAVDRSGERPHRLY
jgi:hypothetical protein